MYMKVSYTKPIYFKSNAPQEVKKKQDVERAQTSFKSNSVSQPISVKAPQPYKLLSIDKLPNDTSIYAYKLANGYRVTIVPMKDSPTIVKNYVNVGSMNETDDIKGISHFLEHMAFNGTKGDDGYLKLNTGDSFKLVDKMGGWANASTNYSVTDYVNSTPQLSEGDVENQIKIIAAMTENLALTNEMIEKEKGPVCSEINMILDDTRTIAMDTSVRTLFNIESSADELIGGSVEHIKNLTRGDVKSYYDKYYTPTNMNLVITGDVEPEEIMQIVAKNFQKRGTNTPINAYETPMKPIEKSARKDLYSNKTKSTEIIVGFSNNVKDLRSEVIASVAKSYLKSSEVGLTDELFKYNTGFYLGEEAISNNPEQPTLLYMNLNSTEENADKVLNLIYDKLENLKKPSEDLLNAIKKNLKKDYNNAIESSDYVNNIIGTNLLTKNNYDYLTNYDKILETISPNEVYNYIKSNMNINKSAVTMVHPVSAEEAPNISFQGKKHVPQDTDKISTKTLSNNVELVTEKTKNQNMNFILAYTYKELNDMNPVAPYALNKIFEMGINNMDFAQINDYEQRNCLETSIDVNRQSCYILGSSNAEDFEKNTNFALKRFKEPQITQDNLDYVKSKLLEDFSLAKVTAKSLYSDSQAKFNPNKISYNEMIEATKNLTLEDVKKLYKHISQNSYVSVFANVPESVPNAQKDIEKQFGKLATAKPFEVIEEKIYIPNENTQVLTKVKNNSQADIMQVFKYKSDNTIKELILRHLLTNLLTNSSIGLFNTLREKEHLAYSVFADNDNDDDCGEISCNILTTTDNKDIGEFSYDNVQKSINGFNRQIKCLTDSEYTDEDLESAKRILKSSLLNKENTWAKLTPLVNGKISGYGIDYENKIYEMIDKISRDDIQNFANKVFSNKPIYSIVASKDTLDYNQDFLKNLENS